MIYPELVKLFINPHLRDISVLFKLFIIQMIFPLHSLFRQLFWFISYPLFKWYSVLLISHYSNDYFQLFIIHTRYSRDSFVIRYSNYPIDFLVIQLFPCNYLLFSNPPSYSIPK